VLHYVHGSLIYNSQKEPRCPSIEEWIQKMWYIYTMEYYSAFKNNDFMKFIGKWRELENIILSMSLSVYVSQCVSQCLCLSLSVYVSLSLCVSQCFYPSPFGCLLCVCVSLSVCVFQSVFILLSVDVSISECVCVSLCRCVSLSICVCLPLFVCLPASEYKQQQGTKS